MFSESASWSHDSLEFPCPTLSITTLCNAVVIGIARILVPTGRESRMDDANESAESRTSNCSSEECRQGSESTSEADLSNRPDSPGRNSSQIPHSLSNFAPESRPCWSHGSVGKSTARIPHGLSRKERAVYKMLMTVAETRLVTGQRPPHLLILTDLAKDYDDLAAMVVLKELHRLGLVQLIGFIANLMPAKERARFGRGALDLLNLPDIPIAIGLPAADELHEELPYEFDCDFMAPENSVKEDGAHMLNRLCTQAVLTKHPLTLLLLSSLEDVSIFSQTHPTLLKNAVSNIVLQGGYSMSDGHLLPDTAAANNRLHIGAALQFHSFMQTSRIPSVAYTKVAAFATPLTSELFAEMAATRHPLGEHLRHVQVYQDLEFYQRACLPDPAARFQPFMDQQWFLRNKSSWFDTPHKPDAPLPVGDQIIPYLTRVVVYDALAALGAAGNDVLKALNVLEPVPESSSSATAPPSIHEVIGEAGPPSDPGINGQQMANVLAALLKGSLLASKQKMV